MTDISKSLWYYSKKFASKEAQFNRELPLPSYFREMVGDKKTVIIAELGAGPVNTIGNYMNGVEVIIYASDLLQPQYQKMWEEHRKVPIVPIEYQDFEHLTYPDEMFDIVHIVNAIDHTGDALEVIKEAERVCKKGGWIYLRHAPNQRSTYGGMHRWDIQLIDGECIFTKPRHKFKLEGYKVFPEGELIVAIKQK